MLDQSQENVVDQNLKIEGPSWNISVEYPSLTSNEFAYDKAKLIGFIEQIETSTKSLDIKSPDIATALQATTELAQEATILLENLSVYVSCESCIDADNIEAQRLSSELTAIAGRLEGAYKPALMILAKAPQALVDQYLDNPRTKPTEFQIKIERQKADFLLSESEETLLSKMKSNGPMAFGQLYDQVSSTLKCQYVDPATGKTESIGLAQAAGLVRDENETVRRSAWTAIQDAWTSQSVAVTSVLNGISGWRLDLDEKRGQASGKPVHFLDEALLSSRISRETLNAMMAAVESKNALAQKAMHLMASAMGKETKEPWDLFAPAPLKSTKKIEFRSALAMVREAFANVDASAADFVDTMDKNRWIEGRVLPTKRPGAFCTGFSKSRTPRVYQTYMGSMQDVSTLAHELGHAYHSWVIRDLALEETEYPMTLAETASVFAETALADNLMAKAKAENDLESQFAIGWQRADDAVAFMLDIPSRFDFEKSFYEKRAGGFVTTSELEELSQTAYTKWYGSTVTQPNRRIWTKLHFSIPTIRFYNFPYTFGYLFSLGVYAQKEKLGAGFAKAYVSLLRDTGRMMAEDVAMKHLGVDLTKPDFWLASLEIVEKQIEEFEKLAKQREPVRLRH